MMELQDKDIRLQEMLDYIPETQRGTKIRNLINKAIEKAYKAGYVKYNALNHTLRDVEELSVTDVNSLTDERKIIQLKDSSDEFLVGDSLTLLRLYLKENGYAD
jgi:type II secretory pathway component PulL